MNNPTRRSLLLGAGLAVPLLLLPACATTGLDGGMAEGLRRLLAISSERALTRLVADNGFLNDPEARITFPAELNDRSTAVLGALLGSAPVRRQLSLAINRAAGEAADRAAPLIYDSIRSLTFSDALGIVRGGPTAATTYLERSIGDRIIDAMFPEVGGALRQFDGNSLLGPVLGAATGINIAGIQRTVTDQAARGLWRAIGREEAAIRTRPASAGDSLVEAVLNGSRLIG
ncbi:DUF4197 domain-containing protein [Sphingomonas jeddahensis]|uniref:DUF4197 domain-containing protein n=1 Tax=Sphingomonas jeddahensis TaxID=1915074 RepID=A0A1V2EV64_9SPHN|nr:DUF4197 domain-containing protein [Sphingomonas jeddahensis]ONF96054.1 hypothetical protein SPHI_16680 [Sphingomonas jeddahensis]